VGASPNHAASNCHDRLNTGAAGAAAALELQSMLAPSAMRMRCAPVGGSNASQWGPVKPEGQVQPLLPTQLPPLVQYQPPLHSTTLTLQLSPLQWQASDPCQHCHPKGMFLACELGLTGVSQACKADAISQCALTGPWCPSAAACPPVSRRAAAEKGVGVISGLAPPVVEAEQPRVLSAALLCWHLTLRARKSLHGGQGAVWPAAEPSMHTLAREVN
jgi:hypothetical protein